ncbi:DUF420 domain-containing protein [Natronobacterium gregoryi]|uniref:DUF420 domain-containing protein n=2 Tax=Natronobacterium gregoryi TaxID=44930 RepID=L0AIT2_NATGS|nr:DUF420 domain-containing protein [Natronobacterium gregoryi]AFZ73354.1 putative membrane protein [Natronobacterium gregoryi SP2]ELY68669.1 hypothetical protein C490_09031 [Natronobacterium gregoryi SP2]PLK18781.1 DUF420 domain-containing protein [Natronobacterium gregoryi SP2]SFJ63687.1 putative membrane protein [Natronobacterium gregoryi]
MEYVPRERVSELTIGLSVVSLAVVFAAAGGRIPQSTVPAAPQWFLDLIPHVNVAISVTAIATITYGWRAIRRGSVDRHRIAMLASFGLFAAFLVLYLYRLVAVGGPEPFPGPETVYQFVYLPILVIHVFLAVVCVPLVYYALLLAFAYPIEELRRTNHARFGRLAASLWLVSFTLGIVVYVLLHVVY